MESIFWFDEVMNMGNTRDDFNSATKELLANRVGRRCSNGKVKNGAEPEHPKYETYAARPLAA